MSNAPVVTLWGTSYAAPPPSTTPSIPTPTNSTNTTLSPTTSNCTDNNLDTECVTPPLSPYPYVLLQYSQNVVFNNITVTLGYRTDKKLFGSKKKVNVKNVEVKFNFNNCQYVQ
jgi:hypothetical protein